MWIFFLKNPEGIGRTPFTTDLVHVLDLVILLKPHTNEVSEIDC